METELNRSQITEELVKEMGNQAAHAMTHESEPELKLDSEVTITTAPLQLQEPRSEVISSLSTSSSLQDKRRESIAMTANAAKEFVQTVAEVGFEGVDKADLMVKKSREFTLETIGKIGEGAQFVQLKAGEGVHLIQLKAGEGAHLAQLKAEEGVHFAQLKADELRRFALMAIDWIVNKGRMAKETVVLTTKNAGKTLALTGQTVAVSATKAADAFSEGFYEGKEKVKERVRSASLSVNSAVLELTEPAPMPQLSKFDLSLPEFIESEERKTIQTSEEKETLTGSSMITAELVKEMGNQAEHVMTHEAEAEIDSEEESGTVTHLFPQTEAKAMRNSLKDSILMAKQDLKSSPSFKGRSEATVGAPSIRSN
eukprot:TRINITY_DN154_c0_g1_i5.p1 TRINITY_DN154_c0_g1~~TRINITY_DN154_c0_g1_i5.p1  ORF type:complete len:370 (-),score=153.52 TRINITY_DN154_c0_g1_i5:207-1316(-)